MCVFGWDAHVSCLSLFPVDCTSVLYVGHTQCYKIDLSFCMDSSIFSWYMADWVLVVGTVLCLGILGYYTMYDRV